MSKLLTLDEVIAHAESEAEKHDGTLCGTNHKQLAFWLNHYRQMTDIPSDYAPMLVKDQTPKVGIGVIIRKEDRILLGLRKGSHGAGEWGLPGGHQKVGETFWGTCSRELREETGLHMTCMNEYVGFVNSDMPEEGLHYVTLFFEVGWQPGTIGQPEPQVLEPDRCEEWRWFPTNHLPKNLWEHLGMLVSRGFLPGKRTEFFEGKVAE